MATVQHRYAVEQLFEAVARDDTVTASKFIPMAREECAYLSKEGSVYKHRQTELKLLDEIIGHVLEKNMKDAKPKCRKVKKYFDDHMKGYLKIYYERKREERKEVEKLPSGKPGENKTKKGSYDIQRQREGSSEKKIQSGQRKDELPKESDNSFRRNVEIEKRVQGSGMTETRPHGTDIPDVQRRRTVQTDKDLQREKESKRASLAMRQNNPDIADLSDTNRPTKIAERFSELYDNEWTEAFEELSKHFTEKETIGLLLSVAKEAYKHCEKVAEQQIKQISKVFKRIVILGPYKYDNVESDLEPTYHPDFKWQEADDTSSLVLYRKEIASEALPELQRTFAETIKNWKTKDRLPNQLDAFNSYAKKAVDLSWWMCVQDPPVHMCSQEGKFDPNIYRAYTKSGSKLDFIVWPALKLHENGGVLLKGVAQYK